MGVQKTNRYKKQMTNGIKFCPSPYDSSPSSSQSDAASESFKLCRIVRTIIVWNFSRFGKKIKFDLLGLSYCFKSQLNIKWS